MFVLHSSVFVLHSASMLSCAHLCSAPPCGGNCVVSVTSVSGSITASPRHALIMPIYSPAPAQCLPYILQFLTFPCIVLHYTALFSIFYILQYLTFPCIYALSYITLHYSPFFFYNTGLLTRTNIILHYLTPSCIIPHYLTILAVFHLTIFCILQCITHSTLFYISRMFLNFSSVLPCTV